MAHRLATGEIVGEFMGAGTVEARVKTTISPRIQQRLVEADGQVIVVEKNLLNSEGATFLHPDPRALRWSRHLS